jgi:hypothetical protein
MIPTAEAHEHPAISIMLLLIGIVNYILADLTIDLAYTWIFRIFSLISVACIILINWRKAIQEFKKIFSK